MYGFRLYLAISMPVRLVHTVSCVCSAGLRLFDTLCSVVCDSCVQSQVSELHLSCFPVEAPHSLLLC